MHDIPNADAENRKKSETLKCNVLSLPYFNNSLFDQLDS